MIRIIYTWRIGEDKLEAFIKVWKKATNKIHREVKGARGSFMLQNEKNKTEIKTIARWDSFDDWKNWWQDRTPDQMKTMHGLGERINIEIFREVDDFTK